MNSTNESPVIQLRNVSKLYEPNYSSVFRYLRIKEQKNQAVSLSNINLTIYKGDRIGIVGPNGSGKTTLLKVISGITQPTSGNVMVQAKIVSMIDLNAGFRDDLSGRENINLNGLLVGMSLKEIRKKFDQIVRFSGIENHLDKPFYTYSHGMKFRLAFSIAITSNCDVLILDEVFVSGDLEFQKKTFLAIRNLQGNKHIATIVCSHIPVFVLTLSNKFYIMKDGELFQSSRRYIHGSAQIMEEFWKKNRLLSL